MVVSIVGIIAIFFITVLAVGVCLITLWTNRRIDERKRHQDNQAFQQDMAIRQLQYAKEAGIPIVFNYQGTPQSCENNQQASAYNIRVLGR